MLRYVIREIRVQILLNNEMLNKCDRLIKSFLHDCPKMFFFRDSRVHVIILSPQEIYFETSQNILRYGQGA